MSADAPQATAYALIAFAVRVATNPDIDIDALLAARPELEARNRELAELLVDLAEGLRPFLEVARRRFPDLERLQDKPKQRAFIL